MEQWLHGFFIILAVRDPFKIYIQDLILKITKPEEQQAIFSHLELARKIGQTLIGFVVSAALLKFSMIWIIVGAGVISVMTLKTTIRLFELVNNSEKSKILLRRLNYVNKVSIKN